MEQYIEKLLKRKIEFEKYPAKKLPLIFNGLYSIYVAKMENFEWVIAAPKQAINLKDLRKHMTQLERITSLNCAFYFENVSIYIRSSLSDEGIPFIVSDKEMYLPFAGVVLKTPKSRPIVHINEISFLTQKIVLTALYEKWQGQNVTQVARAMGVTKTSVTRCFDEMESLNIGLIMTNGTRRVITVNKDVKTLWEEIMPKLRSPIIKRFEINKACDTGFKSGVSALSELTMLNDNRFPTYGVLKKDLKDLDIESHKTHSFDEKACEVQELGYIINFRGKNIMDPFSIILSLSNEEASDERIQIAINDMLEEHAWS